MSVCPPHAHRPQKNLEEGARRILLSLAIPCAHPRNVCTIKFYQGQSQVGSLPKKAKKVAKYIRSKEDCLGKGNESQKDWIRGGKIVSTLKITGRIIQTQLHS